MNCFCSPLNSYQCVEPAAALTYRAFLLIAFLPFVLLPMISVSLAIGTTVPTALDAVCHTSTWSHSTWFNFNYPSFFAHRFVVLIVLFFLVDVYKRQHLRLPAQSLGTALNVAVSYTHLHANEKNGTRSNSRVQPGITEGKKGKEDDKKQQQKNTHPFFD